MAKVADTKRYNESDCGFIYFDNVPLFERFLQRNDFLWAQKKMENNQQKGTRIILI